MKTAVVVLVFNRPELTARLLERLNQVRPPRIFVVADGPRPERSGEAEKVAAVRGLFDALPWACESIRDYSATNLGCARRVSSGITRVFEQVEEAIILEDDCLPKLPFFRFCEDLLERYRADTRVGSICGTDFTFGFPRCPESYYFSRYNLFWGWATWRRAWFHYDHAMKPLSDGGLDALLRPVFPEFRARLYWRMVLRRTQSGRLNSWGYRWLLSCWRTGMLGILPSVGMVENLGIGTDSTHTIRNTYGTQSVGDLEDTLRHPAAVARDWVRDGVIEDRMYSRSLRQRLLWCARKLGLSNAHGRMCSNRLPEGNDPRPEY